MNNNKLQRITLRIKQIALASLLLLTLLGLGAETVFTHKFGTKDGLLQYSVSNIFQDSSGFVWLATEAGVSRFDGLEFTNFNDSQGYVVSPTRDIFEHKGTLYFLSNSGQLYTYQHATFSNLDISGRIYGAFTDHDRNIWLIFDDRISRYKSTISYPLPTHSNISLNVRPQSTAINEVLYFSLGAKLFKIDGGAIFHLQEFDKPILNLMSFKRELLIVLEDTVISFDLELNAKTLYKTVGKSRLTASFASRTHWLLGTNDGQLIKGDGIKFEVIENGLSQSRIFSIFEDNELNIWLGLDSGGFLILPKTDMRSFTKFDGVGTGDVFYLQYDKKLDRVWVGTRNGGVASISNNTVSSFTEKNGLSTDHIRGLFFDDFGTLWVGTAFDINRIDRDFQISTIDTSNCGVNWRSFTKVRDGRILSGSYNGEIIIFENNSTSCINLNKSTNIRHIIEVRHSLYALTESGLFQVNLEKKSFQSIKEFDGFIVRGMVEDSNNTLWLVTKNNGLWIKRRNKNWSQFKNKILDNRTLVEIFIGTDDTIYIASSNGIFVINSNQVTQLSTDTGLASNIVFFFALDNFNKLWVGGDSGIDVVHQNKVLKHYDYRDGLADNETNFFSSVIDKHQNIWIATMQGVSTVNTRQVTINKVKPKVAISKLVVAGRNVHHDLFSEKDINLVLDSSSNNIEFFFSGLSYRKPRNNRFQYKLAGLEDRWSEWSKFPYARFTALSPNKYSLLVRVKNSDGVLSDTANFDFMVLPAFWQTIWFKIFCAVIFLFIVFLLYRLRISSYRKHQEQLKVLVAQRTEELKEANEELKLLTYTDPLTELNNRRYLEEFIQQFTAEIDRLRYGNADDRSNFYAFMIDLDYFKNLNDTLGHEAGDKVLVESAERLKCCIRDSDVIIRWGGEEFLVIAKGLTLEGAALLSNRLLESINETAFEYNQSSIYQTCSVGFSTYPFFEKQPNKVSWKNVIDLADQALYRAKKHSRNCYVGVIESNEINNSDRACFNISDLNEAETNRWIQWIYKENQTKAQTPNQKSQS